MKKTFILSLVLTAVGTVFAQKEPLHPGYPIDPVPFTSVKVTDHFWGQRLKTSREVTIPLAFRKSEETGRIKNFEKAAHPSEDYKVEGFSFDDTDIYKTIEGASYSLQTYPDKRLEKYIDSILAIVATAQEPDGYLYTARTMNPKHPHDWVGKERWVAVENLSHEFYNLGHMIEGAIAHYQATGKRNFLDIAIKYADCVCRAIGNAPEQKRLVPGHQIAEMALVKLYLVTGDRKYLDQAKFFLDARGYTGRKDAYSQAHKPVRMKLWGMPYALFICILAWQTWLPLREIALTSRPSTGFGTILFRRRCTSPVVSAPVIRERLSVIITNCPIFPPIAKPVRLSAVFI
jgi:DUF1680 family protein